MIQYRFFPSSVPLNPKRRTYRRGNGGVEQPWREGPRDSVVGPPGLGRQEMTGETSRNDGPPSLRKVGRRCLVNWNFQRRPET